MTQATGSTAESIASLSNSDIIAICAVVVALTSICIAIWQGYISRKHNHLSVKPHIDIDSNKIVGRNISCQMFNHGVGPAFISSLTITCDDQPIVIKNHNDYKTLFKLVGIDLEKTKYVVGVLNKESALAQGKDFLLFEFATTNSDHVLNKKLLDILPRFIINIEYKCVYGNKYLLSCKP